MDKRYVVIDEYPCPARTEAPKFRITVANVDGDMMEHVDEVMRYRAERGVCPVTHESFNFDDPKRKRIVREMEEFERGI